jgi:hypothetical protein
VLSVSCACADGSIVRDLTIRNGRGPAAADSSGAGLYIVGSDTTIENCIIRNNVQPSSEGNGAGLYATASTLTVRSTRFEGNSTGLNGDGAGVYLNGGPAVFEGCVWTGNTAEVTLANEASGGGAIWVDSGTFTFVRCTFTMNQAEVGGAVYATTTSTTTFDACRFDGNVARYGAGLFVSSAATSSVLRNSVLINNHSLVNDSPLRADKPLAVVNCTIAGNTADNSYVIGSAAADRRVVTVDNCIIWGNVASTGITPVTGTNAPVLRRCLIQSPYTVANGSAFNTVADPLFVNPAAGNFRLQPASPAIDAGDTALYFGPLADCDVLPRGADVASVPDTGLSVFGPVVDIGAYEVQTISSCYANCDNSSIVPVLNVQDFSCFLNAFAAGCP